jgi:DNA-binding GntR family transcriptional regulator
MAILLPKFEKIKRQSITTKVCDYLKQGILTGAILPGTRLLEAQIAEQMGVSRSPVRESFRLLEADGLIEIRPGQGAFVRRLTVDEVWEISTARSLIEGYVASLAAERATPGDVKRLRQALNRVDEAAQREDYEATVTADFDLHRLVWEISGHKVLYDILTRLEVQIRMFMAVQAPLFEHLYDSVRDHQAVVEAIASGNAEAAKVSIEQHIVEAGTLAISHWSKANGRESTEQAVNEASTE